MERGCGVWLERGGIEAEKTVGQVEADRKFETNIPRKGTERLQSQLLYSCFCERFIYSSDQSAFFYRRKIGGSNVGRSLPDT
jgi:hypothetical protein